MRTYLDPTGHPYFAKGVCDRCGRQFLLDELIEDGNLPGLRVCRADWDELDPYRLPPRQPDRLVLPFVRPEVPVAVITPSVPYSLPGYIMTEDSEAYIITEDGASLIIREESA